MKPEEALDALKRMRIALATARVDGIRVLEPLNIAIEATEKQVAIKPKILDIGYDFPTGCSLCDSEVSVYDYNYCKNCGKKLDWGNEK